MKRFPRPDMKILRSAVLAALLLTLFLDFHFVPEADAVLGVRRRTAVRTAVVVSSASNAKTEQAEQEAAAAKKETEAAKQETEAAKQETAAAKQEAEAARQQAAAAGGAAQPLGRIVTALPQGCETAVINGAEYQHCGPDYYRAAFQGSQLVYVTTKPE